MPTEPNRPTKLIPVDELQEIVTEAGLVHQRDFYETSLSNLIVKVGNPGRPVRVGDPDPLPVSR
jgi:hypothetical protein